MYLTDLGSEIINPAHAYSAVLTICLPRGRQRDIRVRTFAACTIPYISNFCCQFLLNLYALRGDCLMCDGLLSSFVPLTVFSDYQIE